MLAERGLVAALGKTSAESGKQNAEWDRVAAVML